MTTNPYIQHLISDPTFGYLFPHRLSLAAFGVPNEYQLNKHRPRLTEGQHFVKIRGADHVERLFYSLTGLLLLADLVNTPQAQAFKQALIAHTQSGGPLVQAQPAALQPLSNPSPAALYAEPSPTVPESVPQPSDPAYLIAQYLQTPLEQALERSVSTRVTASRSSYDPQIPQDTAALIFEAQRLAHEQAQQTAKTLLEAHRLTQSQSLPEIHVQLNLWKRWDDWLSSQDTWAMSLIAAAVIALASISAYFLVSAAVSQSSHSQTSIPSQL